MWSNWIKCQTCPLWLREVRHDLFTLLVIHRTQWYILSNNKQTGEFLFMLIWSCEIPMEPKFSLRSQIRAIWANEVWTLTGHIFFDMGHREMGFMVFVAAPEWDDMTWNDPRVWLSQMKTCFAIHADLAGCFWSKLFIHHLTNSYIILFADKFWYISIMFHGIPVSGVVGGGKTFKYIS